MKLNLKLHAITAGASLLPLLVFAACGYFFALSYTYALCIAAVSALAAAFLAAGIIRKGIASPIETIAASVKRFMAADYRLEAVIPRAGWPEAGSLISALNRLMLELSAYRAFQLSQIVEERGKAKALMETITDGVLLIDDRGALIYSNQIALRLLGIPKVSPEVSIPLSVKKEAFSAVLAKMLASGEKYQKAEVDVSFSEEKYIFNKNFRLISSQFMLATLKRPGRVIIIRDITNEKELEKAKETFFHMITHDMRAPLTSIQGYALLLVKAVGSSAIVDKCLQSILSSSRRLNGMIDDILNTIKLESGDMPLQLDTVDAGELASRICEAHDPAAGRKNIKLAVLPPQAGILFTADPKLLERVITNLLANSLKFTPSGGSITLACWETVDQVCFAVEDTGPFIPEDKRALIFEKYYQMEEHKHMGFGLGLAMCRMTVELHGGRIWVESEAGKSNKFTFTISKKLSSAREKPLRAASS